MPTMKIIARWLVVSLSLLLAAKLVPGIEVASLYTALIVALALGLVNAILRPVLILLT
jgi:putative membrane protein